MYRQKPNEDLLWPEYVASRVLFHLNVLGRNRPLHTSFILFIIQFCFVLHTFCLYLSKYNSYFLRVTIYILSK